VYQSIDSNPNPSLTHCRVVVFSFVALLIIVFSIYSNSFNCSWHFDDEPNITDNPNLHLKGLTWENLRRALFSDRNNPTILYRPAACITFALNHYFGGLNVFGYHLVNILIHLLSSIFLFLFTYHTLNLPSIKTRYAADAYFIALLSTTLWAINPIHTQAVTYIVQRMASLACMFYIMSMYFYLRARTTDTNPKKVLLFTTSFISFLMALGSKENAAMLPLMIFLYEILFFQQITRQSFRRYGRLFLIVAGAILILGFTYVYIKGGNIFSFLDGYRYRQFTLAQRLLTEPRILVFYITLLLYPVPNRLSITHSVHLSTSLFDPMWTLFSMILIGGILGYALYLTKKRPLFSFCILFFFLNHVIESTIFPLELIFEHRNYIPSMLFFLPIAIGLSYLLRPYEHKKTMKIVISLFIILLLIGFGHATFMRNFDWKSEKTLWSDAATKAPDHLRPHHNLGKYYHDHGNTQKAILEYEKALTSPVLNRKDESFFTYYNLAQIYADSKNHKKALFLYHRALLLNPHFPPIYNNIATIIDKQGQYELGYRYLAEAFRLQPNDGVTNLNLGLYYLRKKQPEEAIKHLQRSADEKKFGDRVLLYLGIAFKQKGQLGRAVTHFNMALKKNPRNPKIHLHLAEIFYRTGDNQQARRHAARAIHLIPDRASFRRILDDLQINGPLANLQPEAAVVVPLMRKSCIDQSETLKEWSILLDDKPSAVE
jgi:tetratricopeptide (TPR) repeat protein